jgi:hypothetical protein
MSRLPKCVNYEEDYDPSDDYQETVQDLQEVVGIDLEDYYREHEEV